MITSGNTEIKSIYYNGYTISRVYSCGGYVWSGDTPTPPTDGKLYIHWNDDYRDGNYTIPCDSSSAVTNGDVRTEIAPFTYRNIVEVNIGECVTTIDETAFYDCTHMLRVNSNTDGTYNIPSGITSIDDRGFDSCSALVHLSLPDTLTTIGGDCFKNCRSLVALDIPDSVTSIGNRAFAGCTSLASLEIGSGLTTIPTDCFLGCTSLITVDVPSNVTTISESAFRSCTALSSVTISSAITNIGDTAFANDSRLESVTVWATTPPTLGNNAFYKSQVLADLTIYVPCESVDAYKAATNWSSYASKIQAISGTCHDYSKDYLTFIAKEKVSFAFHFATVPTPLWYSINGGSWVQLNNQSREYTQTVNAGDIIQWRGTLTPDGDTSSSYGIGRFISYNENNQAGKGRYSVEGNIMSLMYNNNFDDKTSLSGQNKAFTYLFSGNTELEDAENLVLPATTLSTGCYSHMFQGCTSLTSTPVLPAETLAISCYSSMFYGCSSLATAPYLPATTLASSCYSYMFKGCTSLSKITCLATDISATSCTSYWVENVSQTGTFVKASSMNSWTTGVNGIPSGWTVQDA